MTQAYRDFKATYFSHEAEGKHIYLYNKVLCEINNCHSVDGNTVIKLRTHHREDKWGNGDNDLWLKIENSKK